MDDNTLIKRAAAGDERAFEALVNEYSRLVFSVTRRLCKNEADAEDAAQEVFLKFYRSLSAYRGEAALSSYLYRIATNVCMDFMRRRNECFSLTDEEYAEIDIKDTSPDPEEQAVLAERREVLEKAIASLSYEHREMITLRDIEGLSYAEIAAALSLPENTVKSRILRARRRL